MWSYFIEIGVRLVSLLSIGLCKFVIYYLDTTVFILSAFMFFRNTESREVPSPHAFSQGDPQHARNYEAPVSKKVTFGDLVRSSELDEPGGSQSDREPSANWNSNTAATTTVDDPNSSFSPFLPPVLEEPSSSFSEGLNLLNPVSLLL